MDRMNDNMKAGHKLQSLTLLSHVVRRQPSWLHKIVQAPLFMSLLNCLKVVYILLSIFYILSSETWNIFLSYVVGLGGSGIGTAVPLF